MRLVSNNRGLVGKRQRTIDKMMSVAGPLSKEVVVSENDLLLDVFNVTKLAESPTLGTQMVEAMRNVREATLTYVRSKILISENLLTNMRLRMASVCCNL